MAEPSTTETLPPPQPIWIEFRDAPAQGFGSRHVEYQVIQQPAAPASGRGAQVPDGTPLSAWAPWEASLTPGVTAG